MYGIDIWIIGILFSLLVAYFIWSFRVQNTDLLNKEDRDYNQTPTRPNVRSAKQPQPKINYNRVNQSNYNNNNNNSNSNSDLLDTMATIYIANELLNDDNSHNHSSYDDSNNSSSSYGGSDSYDSGSSYDSSDSSGGSDW